jgi:hypothetical protein
VNIHLHDNDTFECRLILIDRGLLDRKQSYSILLRVNGKSINETIMTVCLSMNIFVESPRFIDRSEQLQIATHHSTVVLRCQVYAVPYPIVTWYNIADNNKQTNHEDQWQEIETNSQQ